MGSVSQILETGSGVITPKTQRIVPATDGFFVTGPKILTPTYTFNRPADTTGYVSGDLIANNTAAGSVVLPSFAAARANGGTGLISRATIRKSTTTALTCTLYFFVGAAAPTVANGDNGAWSTPRAGLLGNIGIISWTTMSDGAVASAASSPGIAFTCNGANSTLWAILVAGGAYAPGNAEAFEIQLDITQG